MTGTTNSANGVSSVIRSDSWAGESYLKAGTYDIDLSWNGKVLALWTSGGSYIFNLTRATSDTLPLGFEVTIVKLSTANTITLNHGASTPSTEYVQMYRVKDNKMTRFGTFTLASGDSNFVGYIKLKKVGGKDASWLMESNIGFS